ncbi:hypothetical protein BaRGS_00025144 [Batillaria attramentaria]|uniref:Uncharacterized protein n=1 Tax=Batillaria attramentaria TaxID=370345 RepID=A0ABD0K9J1_9CAEN
MSHPLDQLSIPPLVTNSFFPSHYSLIPLHPTSLSQARTIDQVLTVSYQQNETILETHTNFFQKAGPFGTELPQPNHAQLSISYNPGKTWLGRKDSFTRKTLLQNEEEIFTYFRKTADLRRRNLPVNGCCRQSTGLPATADAGKVTAKVMCHMNINIT